MTPAEIAKLPTPRTDNEAFMLDDGQGEAVMSEFARRQEQAIAAMVQALEEADRLLDHANLACSAAKTLAAVREHLK